MTDGEIDAQGILKTGDKSDVQASRQFYDDWAKTYDGTLEQWGYEAPKVSAEILLAEGAPVEGTVMDIGCGTGMSGASVRAVGFRGQLVGIDVSQASLDEAAQKTFDCEGVSRKVYDDLKNVDLTKPCLESLETGSADGIVCVGVLTYLAEQKAYGTVFSEMRRALKPAGLCVFTHLVEYQDEAFYQALEASGLEIKRKTEPRDYLPGNPDFKDKDGKKIRYFVCMSKSSKKEAAPKKEGKKEKGKKEAKPAEASPAEKTPEQIEEDKKKKAKKVWKEGGKRGVEIEGAADMGGLKYFCTSVDEPEGDMDLLTSCMDAMNQKSDPTEEERKGGSGAIGKMIFSAGDHQLAIVAYIPEAEKDNCDAKDWLSKVLANFAGEMLPESTGLLAKGFIKTDSNNNKFPLKMKEPSIMEAINYLKKKGLFPDKDDSDDEMVFGDDDFPS